LLFVLESNSILVAIAILELAFDRFKFFRDRDVSFLLLQHLTVIIVASLNDKGVAIR